jgi:hypothetical protein
MKFLFRKILNYTLRLYVNSVISKNNEDKSLKYLIELTEIANNLTYSNDLVGFNSAANLVTTPCKDLESLVILIVKFTSAIKNTNPIYRGLLDTQQIEVPLKIFLINKNNEQLDIQSSLKALFKSIEFFCESLTNVKDDKNEVNKTNIFILTSFIASLCVVVEDLIKIQLNTRYR